jgi:hypothetical protein
MSWIMSLGNDANVTREPLSGGEIEDAEGPLQALVSAILLVALPTYEACTYQSPLNLGLAAPRECRGETYAYVRKSWVCFEIEYWKEIAW